MQIALLLVVAGLILYGVLFLRSIFIIAYHGVGPETTPAPGVMISPESFQRQMRMLRLLGFRNTSVDSMVGDLAAGRRWWSGSLALTFDDGYRNLVEHAVPVLEETKWTATIFIPTARIGATNDWDQSQGFPAIRLLDWADLARLAGRGFAIGSHGATHRSVLRLSDGEFAAELEQSLAEVRKLPLYSRVFCYPYGHFSARAGELAERAGYIGACALVAGALAGERERFALGRIVVKSDSSIRLFGQLAMYPLISFGRMIKLRLRATD